MDTAIAASSPLCWNFPSFSVKFEIKWGLCTDVERSLSEEKTAD